MRTDRYEFLAKISSLAEDCNRWRLVSAESAWWIIAGERLEQLITILGREMWEELEEK
jgi:hypothetical protein